MNRQRVVLYLLLSVVAAAAAVLSFAALRDLAIVCGFDARLAWLLPIVIDAGAAAGSLAWLGSAAPRARSYARVLALVLLASTVGGNALGHGLAAYSARPHWGVVVAVSAVAPAVLGALVHLVVLAVRPAAEPEQAGAGDKAPPAEPGEDDLPDRRDVVDTSRDSLIIADLRALAGETGRRYARDEVKVMYGIGSPKAQRILTTIGWFPRAVPDEADQAAPGGQRAEVAS